MQQKIRLLGDLGERYGSEHVYQNMRTPAEAIKLLCLNFPELQGELQTAHERDVGYTVVQAGVAFADYGELDLPLGKNDLVITPVLVGSGGGGGLGKIFLGIGLVAAAFFTGGATIGLLGLAAPVAVSTVLAGAGASLILGGASQALASTQQSLVQGGVTDLVAPQIKLPKLSGQRMSAGQSIATDGPQSVTRGSDGRQSYAYQGAANTVGVGATIPVAYGKVLAGSHLISANVTVTDDSDPLTKAIKQPGPDTVTVGGEQIIGLTRPNGLRTRRWEEKQLRYNLQQDIRTLTLELGNSVQPRELASSIEWQERDNFQIFFDLDQGLFDYVSGPGTTRVDGYITYQVQTTHRNTGTITSNISSTVQGLLLKNQKYRWMHFIQYAKINNEGVVDTKITILDFRAHSSCRLRVRQVGYKQLLLPDRYNYPPVDG